MNPAPTPLYAFHSYLLTPHSFQVLTMPQTPKLSPQQKVALVEKIKAGEISRQAAAQSVGVSNTTVRQWLRIYESEGADGLAPREKSRHLTAEEKQAAVAEYLAGGVSLFDVCKKYGIRSPQNLQKLVEKAQAGGELRGYHGASRHRGGAYTTAADREKIVRECLANGCDYGATALKYNVDYKALVHWVGQYRAGAALHDARHSSEGTSRARGRARAVPPMQRMVMVLDCLENRKNYGAMAQKYAIAYHQIYRWVQRYLQDGWLGMKKKGGGGDIVTPEKYKDFIFTFDFQMTKGANSGVKYYFDETLNGGTCEEYQVLENAHPDSKRGKDGNRKCASLYDLIPAHADKVLKGAGAWNSGKIVAKGKTVEHWLNGQKVLSYERGSEDFRARVAASKYAKRGKDAAGAEQPWGEIPEGRILLQDHGDSYAAFCNLKIKRL